MKYHKIGQLKGFPEPIVEKMLYYQVKQGNKKDISVFENYASEDKIEGGFYWAESDEGHNFWVNIIKKKQFDIFFKRYPVDSSFENLFD